MTADSPRNYARLGAAVVILVVIIGAGIFATSLFETAAKQSQSAAGTATTNASCTPTNDLAAPRHFAFNVAVNYTGKWGATVTGYSGVATPAFVECYTGNGLGFIYLSDWNQGGQAILQVVAQKTDSGNGNLSVSATFGSSNSTTRTNSTSLPDGSATVTATMLGEAAIVQSGAVTTPVPVRRPVVGHPRERDDRRAYQRDPPGPERDVFRGAPIPEPLDYRLLRA